MDLVSKLELAVGFMAGGLDGAEGEDEVAKDCATTGTEDRAQSADVGGRERK